MRIPLVLILSGALVSAVFVPPARAQSLGDLARQEAERRKALKAPEKIITNKDVPRVPQPEPVQSAGGTPTAPADAPAADAAKPSADGAAPASDAADVKDQKYWSERHQLLQAALEHDEVFAQALQSRINALTTDFVNRDDPAQRAVIANDRQKAIDEMARVNDSIVADRKALADFDDEARRAAVPPGWLR